MKTLVSLGVTLVLFVGCSPCTESDAPSRAISCGITDGGYLLADRPYFVPTYVPDLVSCVATINAGKLDFVTRERTCVDNRGGGIAYAICEVPPLPPGEYPLPGGDVLTLPADGGAPTCTNN